MTRIYKKPFADDGQYTVIPEDAQADDSISVAEGWTNRYEKPDIDPDYLPINREETNGIFHEVTEALGELQQYGFAKWQPLAAGWPDGARVVHQGTVYKSTTANNTTTPGSDPSWVQAGGSPTSITDSDGDTSVETERTADDDTVWVKAGGTDVMKAQAAATSIESVADAAGTVGSVKVGDKAVLGMQGGAALIAEDSASPGDRAFAYAMSFDAGGSKRQNAGISATEGSHSASVTVVTKETDGGGAFAQIKATGAINLEANGSGETAFNDTTNVDLPAAYASIMAAIQDLEDRKIRAWAPTFSAGTNAASVTVVQATKRSENGFVTLEGTVEITPTASGYTEVTAPTPTTATAAGVFGPACAIDTTQPVQALAHSRLSLAAELSVAFDAASTNAHRVGFRVTYKET